MKKKRLKRKLNALVQEHEELVDAQRRLATHAEVVALAVRSRDRVPAQDLDDAISGLRALSELGRDGSRVPSA